MTKNPKKQILLVCIGAYLLLYGFLLSYDYYKDHMNGLIAGWRYHRIMLGMGVFGLLLLLLVRGFRSSSRLWQNLALSFSSLLFLFLLLEAVSWVIIKTKWLPTSQPRHHLLNDARDLRLPARPFWGDIDPDIAFWRIPQDTITKESCLGHSIQYRTNFYGARDKERTRISTTGKRIVVLGDSFMEGFMVDTPQRVSDRLEKRTGYEHLNFGIMGTSPIEYYLTYKHKSKKFEHDAVIIGVLPANDFETYKATKKITLIESPTYRPYWNLENKPYQLEYSLDSLNQSAYSMAHYKNPGRIYRTIDQIYLSLPPGKKVLAVIMDNSYTYQVIRGFKNKRYLKSPASFSRYNLYSEEEWKVFAYSMEKLFKEAAGKRVLVVTYPILSEIKAYDLNKENRLSQELKALCDRHQVYYLDMLPYFHAYEGDWQDLYVPCDGHWSERGEEYVSEILYNHPLYQALLSPKTKQ